MTTPSDILERLAGKAVIVTGATSGIEMATAIRLHAEGAYVLATGRDAERGHGLVRSLGERIQFHAADITEPEAADGATDALVNNAAVDHTDQLVSAPMARIRDVFEVNTFATIAMIG